MAVAQIKREQKRRDTGSAHRNYQIKNRRKPFKALRVVEGVNLDLINHARQDACAPYGQQTSPAEGNAVAMGRPSTGRHVVQTVAVDPRACLLSVLLGWCSTMQWQQQNNPKLFYTCFFFPLLSPFFFFFLFLLFHRFLP